MRHNTKRSSRGRPQQQQQKKTNGRMRVYESNGPDVKIRGTAYQVTEKYETLAKDAETSGNTVLAENYRQHAEHYQRIINSFVDEAPISTDVQNTQSQDEKDEVNDMVETNSHSASEHQMAMA